MARVKTQDNAFFGHPKPLSSLFFTEMWERFSFYGIRPILILFMVATVNNNGLGIDTATASAIVGIFGGAIYLAALPGGWIADNWLGQERSVWYGSIIIALGHLSIALSAWLAVHFFYLGLILIVIGSGLFKTCISVIVGMLYKEDDQRRDSGFSIFYMGINLGAFLAPIIGGVLNKQFGWHAGFAVGGVGMLIALLIFRTKAMPAMERFADAEHIEKSWGTPKNITKSTKTVVFAALALFVVMFIGVSVGLIPFSPTVIVTYTTVILTVSVGAYFLGLFFFAKLTRKERFQLIICLILFTASAFFWSAFEQQPTSMNLFVDSYTDRHIFGFEVPTEWFQSVNSIFIIIFAPLFAALWPLMNRYHLEPSSITKFAFGLFFAAIGFVCLYTASKLVVSGDALASPSWMIACMLFLTFGELCLSPVGLSIMTKIAPKMIRGQIMGLWFASLSLGNLVASKVGGNVHADTIADLPDIFFTVIMALVIVGGILLLLNIPIRRIDKQL
ncbi:peptide MFS transporter [Ignatzschineria rhizosphaerae]|uniref:Peptide MFS transporter n=1 Tax=Ignatzschineria rhizosphaerae TaxID=2923279 RepID=A0ABY3X5E9_9GAMM|nr:peptide MFS transporter [Ignatzschineria rhizosphaerae]UNM96996.1 peptide MFS transporter [Ignatzschineria rhizosphaerae]